MAVTGAELRARRDALGLTQAQLAARLGVTATTVARWERAEADFPPYLADALSWHEHRAGRPAAAVGLRGMEVSAAEAADLQRIAAEHAAPPTIGARPAPLADPPRTPAESPITP